MTETHRDSPEDNAHGSTTARLREGYDAVYDRTAQATKEAIDVASSAARRTTQGLEANPLGLLAGGLAVGAVIGALLPRSDREKQLLAPVGARLTAAATAALAAAKDAGRSELEARGLTRDSAQAQAKELFQGVLKAAGAAGAAATDSAKAAATSTG